MKLKAFLISLPLLFTIIIAQPITSEARSYSIDQSTIHAFILPDGDVYVEELFTYSFDGQYNGTTRTIGDDKFDGLEFFNAYEAPLEMTFETFDSNRLQQLKVEQNKYTFKAYNAVEDAKKQVHYRYQIKNAARKYKDVGEFYWRFFDSMNESDIHNLEIDFYLLHPDTNESIPLPKEAKGFIHDLHGGSYQMEDYKLQYKNDILPAKKWSEQRMMFPASFLSDMKVTDPVNKYDRIIKEEAKYDRQVDRRNKWVPTINRIDKVFLGLFILLLIYALVFPKRLIWLFKKPGNPDILKEMDSLTLIAMKKRLKFKYTDINAALFTMHQEGNIRIEHQTRKEESEDNPTLVYVLTASTIDLREHEQHLVEWLFKETVDGKPAFNLDQFPVWDPKASVIEKGRISERFDTFNKSFKAWRKLVKKDADILQVIKPVLSRKLLLYIVIPFWILWGCFHLFISVQFQLSMQNYLALAAMFIIWVIPVIGNIRTGRVWIPFYLATLAAMAHILEIDDGFGTFLSAHYVLIACAVFLPITYPTLNGIRYKKGFRNWRKAIQKGTLPINTDAPDVLERYFQHAIVLELESVFFNHYLTNINTKELGLSYPLLATPQATSAHFSYIHYNSFSTSSSSGGSTSSGGGGSGGGGGAGAF